MEKFDSNVINNKLPPKWYITETEHESIIRIDSDILSNYYVTIQIWNESYLVIPYIPSESTKSGSKHKEEQQKLCSNIDDAIFHTNLLLNKWMHK